MDGTWKTSVWQHYGAAIDMLEDVIVLCPDHLWSIALWKDRDDVRYGQCWFVAYHPLFWLDHFLRGSAEGFTPPHPFIRGVLPEQPYAKEPLLA